MNYTNTILLKAIIGMLFLADMHAKIHILCTAALVPHEYEKRQKAYIKSLTKLKEYGYPIYVVESISIPPTFLDSYCDYIFYSESNNVDIANKGINEAKSMLLAMHHFQFDPEDIIIKLTGRYSLETREFIDLIEKNLDMDACVREWLPGDIYTALFAMKSKYLLEILETINIKESLWAHPLETIIGRHVLDMKRNDHKIIYLPRLYTYMPSPFGNHVK